MVADSNHRLNSVFTNLPKGLRGFIECNGKTLYSVDLSASQPYILSKVIDRSFFEGIGYGFNLYTVYEDIYYQLNNSGLINNIKPHTNSGKHPFMWGEFFFPKEVQSIVEFQEIPFTKDFYKHVISKGISTPFIEDELLKRRKEFKDKMMYILFCDKKGFRKFDEQINMFSKVFSGVNKWLELSHKVIGKRVFSLVMQRCESWLLLNNVCRIFLDNHPDIPLFTIHDGLFTYKEYTQNLANLIVTTCSEIVGAEPGFKIEPPRVEIYPRLQDVDDEWVEIKPINSEERFNDIKGGVFESNIKRGSDFIKNYPKYDSYRNAA
ncbi:hypothetical protein [Aquirufa aurantiipilula]